LLFSKVDKLLEELKVGKEIYEEWKPLEKIEKLHQVIVEKITMNNKIENYAYKNEPSENVDENSTLIKMMNEHEAIKKEYLRIEVSLI